MKKRLLSALLALLIVLTLLPFGALAAEDFGPYERLLADMIYSSRGEVFGTFFDFDGDGRSELIACIPGNDDRSPKAEIYRLRKNNLGGDSYEKLFEDLFRVVTGGDSVYLAGIVENSAGEIGLLLHTEGTNTIDEPERYRGLLGDYVLDRLFVFRNGRFVQTDTAECVVWHTVPDAAGNSVYDPDMGRIQVNQREMTLEQYQAWYDRFAASLGVYAWLSPYAPEDGLHEDELLSLAKIGFYDVLYTAYYAEPVKWAAARGVTNGTADYVFSPDDACTRGQVVTFLWRAAGSPEPRSRSHPFADVRKGAYYEKAVLWAVEQGITKGTDAASFSPDTPCTRGQVVTFLHRNAGSPKRSAQNPFGDVQAGAFYYDAVLWAVNKGITKGTSASAFSPDEPCTRGQIVTFLYRGLA